MIGNISWKFDEDQTCYGWEKVSPRLGLGGGVGGFSLSLRISLSRSISPQLNPLNPGCPVPLVLHLGVCKFLAAYIQYRLLLNNEPTLLRGTLKKWLDLGLIPRRGGGVLPGPPLSPPLFWSGNNNESLGVYPLINVEDKTGNSWNLPP